MKNPRISARERGLLKGALRRVYSRSDLRRACIGAVAITHVDPTRPRVKKWGLCQECKQPTPSYLLEVDHVFPIIPLNSSLDEMSWDKLIDNLWCDVTLLRALCKSCHKVKTLAENKVRNANKKRNRK